MGFWTQTEADKQAVTRRRKEEAEARRQRQKELKALRRAIKQRGG